jgi:hypothetical protein
MSYDGEYQTAITRSCVETERDLKQEESLFYPNLDSNRLIGSIKCREIRCRALDLYTNLNEGLGSFVDTNNANELFTAEFSEEGGAEGICRFPYFVTRIYCYGTDCDNKKLLCKKLKTTAGVIVRSSVRESGFIISGEYNSEKGDCPIDHYLVGIKCKGGWCSSINLLCRGVEVSE